MEKTRKLSIVIPAYNEEKTIAAILQKVLDVKLIQGFEKEIIIVNDCSKDDTLNIAESLLKLIIVLELLVILKI
ncbi:MAG: hypothetical protein KatS3mg084_0140 [Candidatus Dojkabacteria bacterium]|nr:MAG: hypothetical protein KatS3mg084_0140 [Candidatus Dojkabacteria bacterium]